MDYQLTIDGDEVPMGKRPPKALTFRQRELYWFVAIQIPLHVTTAECRLFFRDPSGALRRLEALGLIEHVERGKWRATW